MVNVGKYTIYGSYMILGDMNIQRNWLMNPTLNSVKNGPNWGVSPDFLQLPEISEVQINILVNLHSNGTWARNEDVFPIENGDIPASYVSLPEGNIQCSGMTACTWQFLTWLLSWSDGEVKWCELVLVSWVFRIKVAQDLNHGVFIYIYIYMFFFYLFIYLLTYIQIQVERHNNQYKNNMSLINHSSELTTTQKTVSGITVV